MEYIIIVAWNMIMTKILPTSGIGNGWFYIALNGDLMNLNRNSWWLNVSMGGPWNLMNYDEDQGGTMRWCLYTYTV